MLRQALSAWHQGKGRKAHSEQSDLTQHSLQLTRQITHQEWEQATADVDWVNAREGLYRLRILEKVCYLHNRKAQAFKFDRWRASLYLVKKAS